MHICLVYDCLYPHTVGGAERWYRNLAERLVCDGHEVTYLTLRQWQRGADPGVPGVEVVTVGPRMDLYTGGRRRILPPLVFGAGVLLHLLRRGRRYDVVHTASFPYFSLLAAGLARRIHRFSLFADWFELWTRAYWRDYLGSLGWLGSRIQRRCVRVPHRAFCFSRLHESRLREEGFQGEIHLLEGLYAGPSAPPTPAPAEPVVVFAGRHIPDKRVTAIPPAVACAREGLPTLRAEIYGDGPDRPELLRQIAEARLEDVVYAPGFVAGDRIEEAFRRALCLVLPSRREGYGLVVIEAAAQGIPTVVVEGADNAATELVVHGENGFIAPSAEPTDLAGAILAVHAGGHGLRTSTAAWFKRNAARLSLARSVEIVSKSYRTTTDAPA